MVALSAQPSKPGGISSPPSCWCFQCRQHHTGLVRATGKGPVVVIRSRNATTGLGSSSAELLRSQTGLAMAFLGDGDARADKEADRGTDRRCDIQVRDKLGIKHLTVLSAPKPVIGPVVSHQQNVGRCDGGTSKKSPKLELGAGGGLVTSE